MSHSLVQILIINYGALILVLLISAFFMIRNKCVFKMREAIVAEVSRKTKAAIDANDPDWPRYWVWFETLPSYNKMVFLISVWRASYWLKSIPEQGTSRDE